MYRVNLLFPALVLDRRGLLLVRSKRGRLSHQLWRVGEVRVGRSWTCIRFAVVVRSRPVHEKLAAAAGLP